MLLPFVFVLVLVSVSGYLYFGKLQVDRKIELLSNFTTNTTVTVERYYKGVPENNSYTLSKNEVETWKDSILDGNYRVSYLKTFPIINDFSYRFRIVEEGAFVLDLTISDDYMELFDENTRYLLQSKKSNFYEELSALVEEWLSE